MTAAGALLSLPGPREELPEGTVNLGNYSAGWVVRIRTNLRTYEVAGTTLSIRNKDGNDRYSMHCVMITAPGSDWVSPRVYETTRIDQILVPGQVLHINGVPSGKIESVEPARALHV
jgi:hypothetical protein